MHPAQSYATFSPGDEHGIHNATHVTAPSFISRKKYHYNMKLFLRW